MIDASDFLPTLAEIAGAQIPQKNIIDGKSFAAQLKGENGKEREWIFIELGNQWYAREEKWKLNQSGQLFDMSNSPFEEKLIEKKNNNPEAIAARKRLQAVLDKLNPAGGILDDGDGSGRHANKAKNVKGKKKKKASDDDSQD
jgi:arylsulfatase A